MEFRSGIIAILGRANVGKSTLLNSLIGQKVAVVTTKPQTTRHRIRGIRHTDTSQMIFLDTPGYHSAKKPLNQWMVEQAKMALADADVSVLLIAADEGWKELDQQLLSKIQAIGRPYVIAISKVDLIPKLKLLPLMNQIKNLSPGVPIVPVCTPVADGLPDLIGEIEERLEPGPRYYPPDQPTDQTMRELAAELVREKLFEECRQEIPYSIAVQIETYEEPRSPKTPTRISAVILVERKSQKMIVIGKGGQLLKKVGTATRKELEKMIGGKVYLSLFVKVAKDWTTDPRKLRELGYG